MATQILDEFEVYLSFEEAPDDPQTQTPETVGDNSLLAEAPWANPHASSLSARAELALRQKLERLGAVRLSSVSSSVSQRRVVPHPRDLRRGSVGWDVLALQRALSAAGLRKWGGFTRNYGRGVYMEVRRFQRRHGLHVDGVYGVETHRKLGPYYDARGIHLLNLVHVKTPAEVRQAKLLAAAQVLYNRRGIVHYTQGPARMWIVRNRLTLPKLSTMSQDYEDCSSSTTGMFYVSGLDDPNGFRFNGYGFTGTQAEHGRPISVAQAKIGCLYFYGTYPYFHVTMNVGRNRCFSHGGESGPSLESPYFAHIGACHQYPGLP